MIWAIRISWELAHHVLSVDNTSKQVISDCFDRYDGDGTITDMAYFENNSKSIINHFPYRKANIS